MAAWGRGLAPTPTTGTVRNLGRAARGLHEGRTRDLSRLNESGLRREARWMLVIGIALLMAIPALSGLTSATPAPSPTASSTIVLSGSSGSSSFPTPIQHVFVLVMENSQAPRFSVPDL